MLLFYSTGSWELVNFVVNLCKGEKSWPYYNFIPVRCYALHYKLAWFCSLLTGNLLFSWFISQNLIFVHKALTFFKVHFKFEVKTSCHRWEISIYYCLTPKVTGDHATGPYHYFCSKVWCFQLLKYMYRYIKKRLHSVLWLRRLVKTFHAFTISFHFKLL